MSALAIPVGSGEHVDYTPGSDVAVGAVIVQGELVGVADRPISANALGHLLVEGVVDFPKATGGGEAIAAGANCYWNTVSLVAQTTASTYKLIGKCVAAAADGDALVRIKLNQ